MRLRRYSRLALGVAAALVLALALVRIAFGWVFPVASTSMLPTLRPGEWVFLAWGVERPRPFDLVAFRTSADETVVKRVWGTPGRRVFVEPTGDVRVDGDYLRGGDRPASIVVYDQRISGLDGFWNHGGTELDPWREVDLEDGGRGFEVDSRDVEGRVDAVLLRFHKAVHDDRLEPDGTFLPGTQTVHDVGVRAEARALAGGGTLRLELFEHGDRFEFHLELPQRSGPARGVLRRREGQITTELAEATFEVPIGDWFDVAFSNVDDLLVARVAGSPPLAHAYASNAVNPRDPGGVNGAPLPERVLVGADRAHVRFRGLVVERDLHVTPAGPHGTERELRLGPDEVYVLGDNPPESRDSRTMGPIPVDQLIGRPVCVVWPPSRWRWLGRR